MFSLIFSLHLASTTCEFGWLSSLVLLLRIFAVLWMINPGTSSPFPGRFASPAALLEEKPALPHGPQE